MGGNGGRWEHNQVTLLSGMECLMLQAPRKRSLLIPSIRTESFSPVTEPLPLQPLPLDRRQSMLSGSIVVVTIAQFGGTYMHVEQCIHSVANGYSLTYVPCVTHLYSDDVKMVLSMHCTCGQQYMCLLY